MHTRLRKLHSTVTRTKYLFIATLFATLQIVSLITAVFPTKATAAGTVTTNPATNITDKTATLNGTIQGSTNAIGRGFEYGTTESFGSNITDPHVYDSQIGTALNANGRLENPTAITDDSSGNLFVVDTDNNRIQKFDSSGTYVSQWGVEGSGDGQFYLPSGITIDTGGNIYVADRDNSRIQKFDSNGTFITKWGNFGTDDGQFDYPSDITIDSSNHVYVVDRYNHRIQKFDSNGNFITKWGSYGSGDGEFYRPQGITADAAGNLYVSDSDNNRIQKFDDNGLYLGQWGASGNIDGQFYAPRKITTDESGNVYVADRDNSRIQKFDSNGTFITKWGSEGSGESEFSSPEGVFVNDDGYIFVADSANNRIQKFNKDGGFIDAWGKLGPYGEPNSGEGDGEYNYPGGMAIDSSNNIYVADNQNDRIQKFTSSGVFVSNIGSTGSNNGQLNKPTGLAIDSSDNMYVADTENNRIQKFNSSGAYESQYALSSYSPALPYSITGISTATNGRLYIGEGAQGRVSALCDSDESSNGCVLGASTANVVVPNAVNTKPISLSQTGCANITNAASLASSALGTQDTDSAYPLGLVGFVLTGCASGGSSTVTVAFAGTSNPKTVKLRKYNASTKKYTDITDAKLTATTISGQAAVQAVYTITDGGPLDGDGTANGSIEDPVGLVTVSGGTLANTGVIAVSTTLLLGLIIGSFTYVYFDYRKHKAPLKAQNPKVKYTLAHHLKVVTIPLLRYRLQVQIARVDNSPIKKW